jgi:pimeloyl-ACP methyl ester carboxylesterase
MPTVRVNGLDLYYEEVGSGTPLIFLHEFGGDWRSWEAQMRFFGRRYRCIAVNYRGYPPSDVPDDSAAYSQDILNRDLVGMMDALGVEKAHLCGLSIGGNMAVFMGIDYPERCLGLVAAGAGHGSVTGFMPGFDREEFEQDFTRRAQALLDQGMAPIAEKQASGSVRIPLKVKDPRGWKEFRDQFVEHSNVGSAYTALGVPLKRPNYYDIQDKLRTMDLPTLVIVGDQDDICIEGSILLKRCLPNAGLMVMPMSGHALNLEEPDLFNRTVLDFLTAVEQGKWRRPTADLVADDV